MTKEVPVRRVKPTGLLADVAKAKASPGIVLPMLKEVMIADHLKDIAFQAEANKHIRPSEMAKADWCPRATYYRLSGWKMPEEDYNFVMENIFSEGDSIEEKWVARARKTGKLWGTWACVICNERVTGMEPPLTGCKYSCGHYWKYKQVLLYPEDSLLGGSEDGAFPHLGCLWECKGLPLDTLLPTPEGWVSMGEVEPGDMLIDSAGMPTKVMDKSEIKNSRVYNITFNDGSSQICDEGHLWAVVSGRKSKYFKTQVLPVEEIKRTLTKHGQSQHRVLLPKPLQLPEVELPCDPYLLGQWLGDGTFRNGSAFITGQSDQFDTILETGVTLGKPTNVKPNAWDRCVHGLAGPLRSLGLAGVTSPNRWIPPAFLRGSYNQRLAILQGIMDADGSYAVIRNQVVFGSTSEKLADGVFELVVSLGGRPYKQFARRSGFGITVDCWDIRWSPTFIPFRMKRKIDKVSAMITGRKWFRSWCRVISSVEEVPSVPTQCVMVDSPDHTYLCGTRMIPTHNSVGQGTLRMDAPSLLARNTVKRDGRTVYDLDRIWKELRRPFSNHVRQVNIYLHLAEVLGLPFDKAVLFYEYKANQQVKEFTVTKSASILDPLLDKVRSIEVALGTGVVPPCGNPEKEQCLCKTVEELNAASHPVVSTRRNPPDGPEKPGSESEAGASGDSGGALVTPARRRTTRRTEGHHGDNRPGSDGAVPEAEPLGEVPGTPARRRTSRRAVR